MMTNELSSFIYLFIHYDSFAIASKVPFFCLNFYDIHKKKLLNLYWFLEKVSFLMLSNSSFLKGLLVIVLTFKLAHSSSANFSSIFKNLKPTISNFW